MKIALIIASRGRADTLRHVLVHWAAQSRPLDLRILSVTGDADIEGVPQNLFDVLVQGAAGSCQQRNRALAHLNEPDVVIFADDDYVPSRHFVSGVAAVFGNLDEVVVATGNVIADGVTCGGIAYDAAARLVHDHDEAQPGKPHISFHDTTGGYGCNMVVRVSRNKALRFDERLPLYGWQEDIDYSRQFRIYGRIIKTDAFAGVHMGVSSARSAGLRLGYSQIVNPIYLIQKGTMPLRFGIRLMARNFAANLLGVLRVDHAVDRPGRLKGNLVGLFHVLCGRITPEYICGL